MKLIVKLCFILFISVHCSAQAPPIQWEKCYGGTGNEGAVDIQLTTGTGYILVGPTTSNDGDVSWNNGSIDCWVLKIGQVGNVLWQTSVGDIGEDQATCVAPTFDGGYIVAGYSKQMQGGHGDFDYLVFKLNSAGQIVWQKQYGGVSLEKAYSIKQTRDSGYIVAGYTYSVEGDVAGNHGDADVWLLKLDTAGVITWQKCLGGTKGEIAEDIEQTTDGGYILTGFSRSTDGDVTGGWPYTVPWIVKTSSTGEIVWQKEYSNLGTSAQWSYSVKQTPDNGYIIAAECLENAGDVTGNHGGLDYWILRLDSNGDLSWQKSLGGNSADGPAKISLTSDGGYIVAGYSKSNDGNVSGNHGGSDFWIVKLSLSGNIQWQKSIGGTFDDVAVGGVQQTPDGGYIIAGYTNSGDGDVTGNHGNTDMWVVKLSPDPLPITLNYFTASPQGKSVLCTWQTLQEQNSSYFEVQRSDDGRHFTTIGTVAAAGNSPLQRNYSFTDKDAFTGAKENLYYRLKMVDIDGSYDYSNIENVKLKDESSISVYPNPVADELFINFNSAVAGNAEFLITDNSGRKVYKQNLFLQQGSYSFPLNVSWLADGMYILSINGKESHHTRFIKRKL